jgi:hypothetical protein
MKWKKCNHRHALKGYDYFVQGPRNQSWPWGYEVATETILHLRKTYGREWQDSKLKDRWGHVVETKNPQWFLDKTRKRIWVKSEILTMLQLRGIG